MQPNGRCRKLSLLTVVDWVCCRWQSPRLHKKKHRKRTIRNLRELEDIQLSYPMLPYAKGSLQAINKLPCRSDSDRETKAGCIPWNLRPMLTPDCQGQSTHSLPFSTRSPEALRPRGTLQARSPKLQKNS